MIGGAQIRAACGMLNWSARELADASGLSLSTVKRMQSAEGVPSVAAKSLEAIQRTLEEAGVGFTNGEEPGVKLKKKVEKGHT
jgi:transcriptional regulator with XRE-family HTH domain